MDEGLFRELFANEERLDMGFNAEWYASLDYLAMRGDQVERYLGVLERYLKAFEEMGYKSNAVYFKSTMENFVLQAQKLNATILILQMPIFVLLAAFIFMVSRQMLEMEQNEIAVYKSRGADKGQIVLVYLLQSLIISVLGLAGGIPLGVLMCRLLGASGVQLFSGIREKGGPACGDRAQGMDGRRGGSGLQHLYHGAAGDPVRQCEHCGP